MPHNDYPLDEEIVPAVGKLIAQGVDVYQKWTCKQCGSRQTMATANIFYRAGKCEECGTVSPITHCNYMIHAHDQEVEI
jgi:translation initiation factor 2 beta subunit (eIF-2beta)/eIF-5